MQPLVRAALAVGAIVVVSGLATERVVQRGGTVAVDVAEGSDEPMRMPCGPREIPEGAACVPIPRVTASGAPWAAEEVDADEEPSGIGIRRRPDRPADVRSLRLPVEGEPSLLDVPGAIAIGGDLDRSILRLGAPRGTPVLAAPLRGQDGLAEVIAIERLPGRGLVVAALATTRDGKAAGEQRWLLLHGSLDGAGPGLARGSKLAAGAVVGFVGEGLSPGEPHVRFEARRLRAGVDPAATPLAVLAGDAESVAVDARNILAPR